MIRFSRVHGSKRREKMADNCNDVCIHKASNHSSQEKFGVYFFASNPENVPCCRNNQFGKVIGHLS